MGYAMKCGMLDLLPAMPFQAVILLCRGEFDVFVNFSGKPGFLENQRKLVVLKNEHSLPGEGTELVCELTALPVEIKAKVKELKAEQAAKRLQEDACVNG